MTQHEQAAAPSASRFEDAVERDTTSRSRGEAFGAGVALLALLVGLPALLLWLSGPPPIPTELPGVRELAQQMTFEDVLSVLVGVVWLAWLFFVICVVLEIVAARRGGLATHVPLGGPFQRLARVLVGALLLSGLMAAPAQAAEAPSAAPVQTSTAVGLSQVSLDAELQTLDDEVEERETEAAVEAAAQAGDKIYQVKPPKDGYHDNLWDIAERHLGDGFRYHEIYELNKDVVQADGRKLELARLIQPGWELVMPDDAVGIEAIPAPPEPAPAPAAPADSAVDSAADASVFDAVGGWKAASGTLAASVLGALLLLRRRKIGRQAAEAARALEADLRVAATTDRVVWLNAVLRLLGEECRASGTTPPEVYAVRLSDEVVELLLSPGSTDPVDGWTIHDEGRRWRHERTEGDVAAPVTGVVPYPALVSVGVDDQGRDVLIDAEAAGGIIAIGGSPGVAEQVASSLAVQAATAPWADTVRVTASALPDGIADIGLERLDAVDDLGAELESIATHVAGLPDDVLRGRLGRRAPAASRFVVAGAAPSDDVADRLGEFAGDGARSLSIAVVGDHAAARWRLRVDDAGNLEIPQLGIAVTANRLGAEQVDEVAELFAAASDDQPAGERTRLPALDRDVDDVVWSTTSHRVSVLGPVEVDGVDHDVPRIDQTTEIVTFLALHPEGVHPNIVGAAVWPRGVTSDVVEAAVERAREWLGTDVDGTHLLRADAEGRLSLADAVVCDWHVLVTLLHRAQKATHITQKVDLLRRALRLVTAEPFQDAPRGRYAWVARDDLPREMARVVAEAAERLVDLQGGDPDGAAEAAEAGLLVAPGRQTLWRSLLRLRVAADGVAGGQRVLGQMGEVLDGIPLDAETEALIDELLPPPSAPAAAGS